MRDRYAEILMPDLTRVVNWIKDVARMREDDIGDYDQLRLDIDQLPQSFMIVCSDETTALSAGTSKVTFRMPIGFTLTGVKGSLTTAATGATLLTVDINAGGSTVLSTKLTFDASEKTTKTAATPAVLSSNDLAEDVEMTIDIDSIGSTIAGAGLKVYLIGYKSK